MIPRPRKHFHLKDVFPVRESNPGPGGESLVSRPLGYQAPLNHSSGCIAGFSTILNVRHPKVCVWGGQKSVSEPLPRGDFPGHISQGRPYPPPPPRASH